MMLKMLIGLGVVFALYWTVRTKKRFPNVITLGMIVGIILALFPASTIQTSGLYMYMGFVALAFVYGFIAKDKKIAARLTICLMAASIFTYWLWVINHWHGNAVLAPILTLLVAIVSIISKVKLKDEWGFLALLAVDAVAIILENWLKAS